MSRTVFYAWQSDTDELTNHHFIAKALQTVLERLNTDLQVEEADAQLAFDRDTQGESGMPAIADTILRKIAEAGIVVADLTFVAKIDRKPKPKYLPNANVSIELGYAAHALGFERIVAVFNEYYGAPADLPFDLVHRRFPVRYKLSPDATPAEHEVAATALAEGLVTALRDVATQQGFMPKEDPFAHAAAPIDNCSFIPSGDGSVARTKARDDDGRESEHVYWHHGPSAWLRLIPACSKEFGRTELRRRVERAQIPLRAFGNGVRQQLESNDYGVILLGYDSDELPHIAVQLTQVFRSGEIWGLNRSLIEPVRTKPQRTFQIPWPATELQFRHTLAHYIDFARDVLELPLPVTLVAGLAMVRDAEFIAEKVKWFANSPKRSRCFQEFIRHRTTIRQWDAPQGPLLDPFFKNLLDECDQDYAPWEVHTASNGVPGPL